MGFIAKLFNKKPEQPKQQAVQQPKPQRNLSGVVNGAGADTSSTLSNGEVSRSTFLGG